MKAIQYSLSVLFLFTFGALAQPLPSMLNVGVGCPPVMGYGPASNYVGLVSTGVLAYATESITNVGCGILSGTASTAAPFAINSNATYSLTAGQWTNIGITYGTMTAGSNYGTLNLGWNSLTAALVGQATNGTGGGACTSVFYTNNVAQNNFSTPNSGANRAGVQYYDPGTFGGSSVTMCAVWFRVTLVNGVNYRASVWTIAGNNSDLGTQVGTYSANVTATGADESLKFTFSSPITLNSGTQYVIVFGPSDGSNFSGTGQVDQAGDTLGFDTSQFDNTGLRAATSTRDIIFSIMQ